MSVSEHQKETPCCFKKKLPHLSRGLVRRLGMHPGLAGLPGTQPAPAPPPAACLCLTFLAQMPRWLVAATAPAWPPESGRHEGLLQAAAPLVPPWVSKVPAPLQSPELQPRSDVWQPTINPQINHQGRASHSETSSPDLQRPEELQHFHQVKGTKPGQKKEERKAKFTSTLIATLT